MADWFKFYNGTLDDPRMGYAISEYPQVIAVYLLLLTEASKRRTAEVPWLDKDFELIGYAHKLNITVPVVNECVNLLCRLEYIKRGQSCLIVLDWNNMQSDYMNRKNCFPQNPANVRKTPQRLRRGEERRGDQIKREECFLDRKELSTADKVIKNKELERALERATDIKSQYEAFQTWSPDDRSEYKKLATRIKVLRDELGVAV